MIFADPPQHPDRSSVMVSVITGTVAGRRDQFEQMLGSIKPRLTQIDHEIVAAFSGPFPFGEWGPEGSCVRWVSSPVRDGAVRAFNDAFSVARGHFVLTLNDDVRLDPSSNVQKAIDLLESDPTIGQVAFAHRGPATSSPIQTIHGKPYANYGLTRADLGRKIARICGGFWCPVYWTYGADCELSAWVWRLGYRVVGCHDVVVLDHYLEDDLRAGNARKAPRDGTTFHSRWPTEETLIPGGPLPAVDDGTLERLALCGDVPHERPRAPAAPIAEAMAAVETREAPDRFPSRDERGLEGKHVVNLYVAWDEEPQSGLRNAIDRATSSVVHLTIGAPYTEPLSHAPALVEACRVTRPDLILIQCQWPEVLPTDLLTAVRSVAPTSAKIVLWSGDVAGRNSPTRFGWYAELGQRVDLVLHTSLTHVQRLRSEHGLRNAVYWQIGFDDDRYNPGAQAAYGELYDVAFLFSRYGRDLIASLPEQTAWCRDSIATLLIQERRRNPRLRFHAGGGIRPSASAEVYQRSHAGINVSISNQLERYSSDRLLRILGSGTACLTQRFPGIETWGLHHGENCLAFDTPQECLALVREIATHDPRTLERVRAIGRAGAALAYQHHTWDVRLRELRALLERGPDA